MAAAAAALRSLLFPHKQDRQEAEQASPRPEPTAAEVPAGQQQAQRLHEAHCLDFEESVVSGLYGVWGSFPELGPEGGEADAGPLPSLTALRGLPYTPGDRREVVSVDLEGDEGLLKAERLSRQALEECCVDGPAACVQALARLVSSLMGGDLEAADLAERYERRSAALKAQRGGLVLPLGCLDVGTARHRALLFKVLADLCELPCRLLHEHTPGVGGEEEGPSSACSQPDGAAVVVRSEGRDLAVTLVGPGVGALAPSPGGPPNLQAVSIGLRWDEGADMEGPELIESTPEAARLPYDQFAPVGSVPRSPFDAPEMQGAQPGSVAPSSLASSASTWQPPGALGSSLPLPGRPGGGRWSQAEAPGGPVQGALSRLRRQRDSAAKAAPSGRVSFFNEFSSPEASRASPAEAPSPRNGDGARRTSLGEVARSLGELTVQPLAPLRNPPLEMDPYAPATPSPRGGSPSAAQASLPNGRAHVPAAPQRVQGFQAQRGEARQEARQRGQAPAPRGQQLPRPLQALGPMARQAWTVEEADEDWIIDPTELRLGEQIGRGSFGEVFKGVWRRTDVAVKRLLEQQLSDRIMADFVAEVSLLRRLRHPNIINFLGASLQPPLCLITEFVPRGSLFTLLHRTPGFELKDRVALAMACDIARGMLYLHAMRPPIIHRDLKSPNLLVDTDFSIKVCDFGMSRVRRSTWLNACSMAGTPEWAAPEVLGGQAYDEKSDIFSFGVILWEMFAREEPWNAFNPAQVVGMVGFGGRRLEYRNPKIPRRIQGLLKQCFSAPEERPSFETILDLLSDMLGGMQAPGAHERGRPTQALNIGGGPQRQGGAGRRGPGQPRPPGAEEGYRDAGGARGQSPPLQLGHSLERLVSPFLESGLGATPA